MDERTSTSLPDGVTLPFEANSHAITPYFSYMSVLSVPDSEREGRPVYELKEMVQLRFAGDRNYSPCFEVTEMWRRVDGRVITYAERFADQYRAFVMGENQVAGGTPLEMLKPYGMTQAQISLCNALKIYSIEAILEMRDHKSLGMSANAIIAMAKRWRADSGKRSSRETKEDIAELKAEIERLRQQLPANEASPDEIDAFVKAADDEYASLSDEELKDRIASLTGEGRPRGNPSRETLIQSLRELEGAA